MAKSGPVPSAAGQPIERVLVVLACALGSVLVLRLFVPVRDPWLDEAMLGLNIKVVGLGDLFRPLPFYEQAAPPGYLALCYLARSIAPDAFFIPAVRAVSTVLMIVAFYLLLRLATAYGGLKSAFLLAAVLLASDFILTYGVELKQYAGDVLATTAILFAGYDLSRSMNARSVWRFFAVTLVASFFSFTAPIPAAAVLGSTLVLHWWRGRRSTKAGGGPPTVRPAWVGWWSLCAVLTVVSVVAIKKLVTDPLIAMQFSAYSDVYQTFLSPRGSIGFNGQILEWLFARIYEFMYLNTFAERNGVAMRHIGMLVAAVAIVVVNILAARKSPYLVLTSLMLFGAILTLNLAKLFPIGYTRHFIFAAPILLVPVALGTSELFETVGRRAGALARSVTTVGVYGALLGLAAFATYRTVRADKAIESRFLRDVLHTDAASPVWVYFGAQPTVRLVAPSGVRFVGMFDIHSSYVGWSKRAGIRPRSDPLADPYLDGFRQVLRNQDSVWLLFTYTDLAARPERSLDPYLAIADSIVGGCKLRSAAGIGRLFRCSKRGGG
jgi:hypothetical protein